MNKLQKTVIVSIVTFASGLSSANSSDEVITIFTDIQRGFFTKPVEFCAPTIPAINQQFNQYLDVYGQGAKEGIDAIISKTGPEALAVSEKDVSEMMVMAEMQGSRFVEQAEANPKVVCSKINDLFERTTKEATTTEFLMMFARFLNARSNADKE